MKKIVFGIALALVALTGGVALAQTTGEPDPGSLISQIIASLGSGQYLAVALLGTAVLVWLAEHFLPKLIPVLGSTIPSALLALAMSLVAPIANLAVTGKLALSEVLAALATGFTAWGGVSRFLSLFSPPAPVTPVTPTAPPSA